MNQFSLDARRPPEPAASVPEVPEIAPASPADTPTPRKLAALSREELLREALYDPTVTADTVDDDRLRHEVRWRRAAALREPALAALARLLSKVSPHTFESLSQGDISPDQLIESANGFVSGQNGVKVLKLPDRVEDHERRLNNLESSAD